MRLMPAGNTLTYIRYIDDFPVFPFTNVWDDTVTLLVSAIPKYM